jgi:protein-S-isoprenylcysteine O-methyltransferase Ste14
LIALNNIKSSHLIWKILYGFLFVVLLPLSLIFWALRTNQNINIDVPLSIPIGFIIVLIGSFLVLTGIINIVIYGKGLPMNAFPPSEFVTRGIYGFISHPIDTGFSFLCIGISVVLQSASGFWLVSPIVVLGCVALIQGYEKHDIQRMFGKSLKKTILSLPADEIRSPFLSERMAVLISVFIPSLTILYFISSIKNLHGPIYAYTTLDEIFPVYEWTKIIYFSSFLLVLLVPFLANSSRNLREFSISFLISTGFITMAVIVNPFTVRHKTILTPDLLGLFVNSFPVFCIIFPFLALRFYNRQMPSLKILWWVITILITLSCITSGIYSVLDVIFSVIIVLIVFYINNIWSLLRTITEHIANSWKEWNIGKIRIINHGIYAGAGTFLGLLITGTLLGPDYAIYIFIVASTSLIMSGLSAQYIESSSGLLRPFGYYGGVLGVIAGSVIAVLLGADLWKLFGGFAISGPFIQAAGRLRCLIQGCCHGKKAPVYLGIRYSHPRSRVCKMSNLTNIPVHPTPLYSILWNIFIGILLARLWSLGASPDLITGLYLILNGMGRFVEESYRGEPQTPVFGRIRLYQMLAVISVILGGLLTTIQPHSGFPYPQFSFASLIVALIMGMITFFALGVDFPNSNKRFSRLV